ncbi:TatD family hydrolase [Atopobium fossor]|uniref:TatD family hydrolase n=1 Tax=Atopobium fossor TaxID=39487 RepID=UPI000685779D|nr:TatD family hydrolase [Atopobium fossor]
MIQTTAITSAPFSTTYQLYDMHLHLDFCDDPQQVCTDAQQRGLACFAVPVTPQSSVEFALHMGTDLTNTNNNVHISNLRIGIGAHPWWIADNSISQADLMYAAKLIKHHRYVGEIGLDFSSSHVNLASKDTQIAAFTQICTAAAHASQADGQSRVLSIHAVQAAPETLTILEQTTALKHCICIFHWYSGPSDTLHKAITHDCLFSINPMMLNTRRGREYARQIPIKQLLTETDLPMPNHTQLTAQEIANTLIQTIEKLAHIRAIDPLALQAQLAHNAANVFASITGGE